MIALYGATGFTGRLVARSLAARRLPLRLVGRDRTKLEALAAEFPGGATFAIAAADDEVALREAFRASRVVVSCAGPFGVHGRHVLDAAIAEGGHYLDISGEVGFAQQLVARDAQARSRGVAVIGCVGFDVVVSDAAAVMACEALEGRSIREVRLTVASTTQPSRGSLRTLLGGLQSGDYEWTFADGSMVPALVGAERWAVSLPPPFERCSAASFGLVEAVVSPRSTGARRFQTGLALQGAGAFAAVARALRWLSRRPIAGAAVRGVLDWAVRLAPEGGDARTRAAARFAVEARATADDGEVRAVMVTGGDVGEVTAAAAAICVARAAAAEGLAAGFQTPAQAFGARWLLDALAASGVAWR